METDEKLARGREAFKKQEWGDAYSLLLTVDENAPLEPGDLELLATSAYLTGKFAESNDTWSRAHNAYLKEENIAGAVRCAFWLGFSLLNKGEHARGGGWIGRARSLLDDRQLDCVEQGYLLLPVALQRLGQGDPEGALSAFDQIKKIAGRFHDYDLSTLAQLGRGQALIRLGKAADGVVLLDEAMANVESGEISPIVVGIVYCAVIETCLEIFDLSRAQEWTDVLSDWCASHPHLVPFRGQCLTRRSEIMQIHGEWNDALKEAHHAIELLSKPNGEPATGAAFYQLGDLYRLNGEFKKAEDAYNEANKWGKKPQPGFALLRLAQGQTENARSSISHALEEAKNPRKRSAMLPVFIEVMLASEDIASAREGANELTKIADSLDAPYLDAQAKQAEGAVLLAEGEFRKALDRLQEARGIWEKINAPYENARTRTLTGKAYRELGNGEMAMMEFEAARWTFQRLKANPDIERTNSLIQNKTYDNSIGLTDREKQVLQLIAEGKSNKSIADELFISERTVERHVSNIFNKLNVSSRSAATSYAYKHQLI